MGTSNLRNEIWDRRVVVVDNTMPLLKYEFPNIHFTFGVTHLEKPKVFQTPTCENSEYNNSNYQHELYCVPDGRWNWNGCPKSVSNLESCLSGDFAKYKLTSAVYNGVKFHVPDFRITEFEFTWDLNGRLLHVVRDSAGAFVTYNWNAFWLVRVETSIDN